MARTFIKTTVFVLALLPMLWIVFDAATGRLSANPIEDITHRTGDWALRFLLITLAITPMRTVLGWQWQTNLRRMMGLYAFFYTLMHFLTWLVLDQFFDLEAIVEDILKRPYITIGFLGFILLIPLAATSTKGMIKRLGGKRWKKLHKSVYAIGMLGVLHYLWLVKADWREPVIYAVILALLLLTRMRSGKGTLFRQGASGQRA